VNYEQIAEMTRDWLRRAGVIAPVLHTDESDDSEGCVDIDGVLIYREVLPDGQIAWGVSAQVVVPGVHTMPNGDPGYPDEVDVVDIAPPAIEVRTISGTKQVPRPLMNAVVEAIKAVVADRLRCYDDYPEEAFDE
jgi:hypothetical protein